MQYEKVCEGAVGGEVFIRRCFWNMEKCMERDHIDSMMRRIVK